MSTTSDNIVNAYREYKRLLSEHPEFRHNAPLPIEKFTIYYNYLQTLQDLRPYTQDLDALGKRPNTFNARVRTK